MFGKIPAAALFAALILTAPTAYADTRGGGEHGQQGESVAQVETAIPAIARPTPQTHVAGDWDGDGDVDGRDFLIWQR